MALQLQAWLTHLEDATLDVDTGSKKQRRHSRVKVHRGFHTSWRLNGMREKVVDLIRSEVCPDEAAARRMKVLFTGEGWPAGDLSLRAQLCPRWIVLVPPGLMWRCTSAQHNMCL